MDILVERAGGREGQMTGRSPYMQSVYFEGDDSQLGQIIPMTISEGRQNSLAAIRRS